MFLKISKSFRNLVNATYRSGDALTCAKDSHRPVRGVGERSGRWRSEDREMFPPNIFVDRLFGIQWRLAPAETIHLGVDRDPTWHHTGAAVGAEQTDVLATHVSAGRKRPTPAVEAGIPLTRDVTAGNLRKWRGLAVDHHPERRHEVGRAGRRTRAVDLVLNVHELRIATLRTPADWYGVEVADFHFGGRHLERGARRRESELHLAEAVEGALVAHPGICQALAAIGALGAAGISAGHGHLHFPHAGLAFTLGIGRASGGASIGKLHVDPITTAGGHDEEGGRDRDDEPHVGHRNAPLVSLS